MDEEKEEEENTTKQQQQQKVLEKWRTSASRKGPTRNAKRASGAATHTHTHKQEGLHCK